MTVLGTILVKNLNHIDNLEELQGAFLAPQAPLDFIQLFVETHFRGVDMGYLVQKLKTIQRPWRIGFRYYTGQTRLFKHIPEDQYHSLGVHPQMSYDQVKERIKQINSQNELKRIQEKRNKIDDRLKEEEIKLNASLPDSLRQEFESLYINESSSKKHIHWRVAKRVITELSIPLEDWCFHKERFYRLFEDKNYSYDYIQKIIFMLNKWGRFVSHKHRTFYENIPLPRAREKERIVDNHEDQKGSQKSERLTPELLQLKQSKFTKKQYNWLYLSLWLGLRPIECDQLLKAPSKTTWELSEVENTTVVWIYQSKLSGIAKSRRMKPIPLKYPEQVKCLEIIKSGEFKRPLNKTIKLHLEGQYTCYAGRKGFTDLMLSKGNNLESISQWLGHQTIDRTWRNYKDKKKVLI